MSISEIAQYYRNLETYYEQDCSLASVLFVEDYPDSLENKTEVNLQFFRILQALGLKSKDYRFIPSSKFREVNVNDLRYVVVLGSDSLDHLREDSCFCDLESNFKDKILTVPSSFDMLTDTMKKREGWEKLKKIIKR